MESVLILENEITIIDGFKQMFEDLDIHIGLVTCLTLSEYRDIVQEAEIMDDVKIMIFDLANTKSEEETANFVSKTFIEAEFNKNRIPIFIHSGFLDQFEGFESNGTVFKIPKSTNSISEISKKIKLFHELGFLNIFSRNGALERKLLNGLHNAFISQFKNDEIAEILKSIQNSNVEEKESRVQEVFERVAIRAFSENNFNESRNDGENIEEIKLNSIEHYFRRRNEIPFWTGDVFRNNVGDLVIVMTPRCNISNGNYETILLCYINILNDDNIRELKSKNGIENFRRNITDDAKKTGERFRFLPRTPQFEGGYIDFNRHFSVEPEELTTYNREISLSEELTNDIIRKFTSYLLRFGVTNTDIFESYYYFNKESNK